MFAVLLTVLSVLKIIGIVLLCILGFILFLILLVLFVPIRYRLDAHVPETDLEEGFDTDRMDVRARFSWLLFVIRGGISFPEDKAFTLRVFGIKILPKKDKGKKDSEDGNGADESEGDSKKKKDRKKKGKDAGKDSEEAESAAKDSGEGMDGTGKDADNDDSSKDKDSGKDADKAAGKGEGGAEITSESEDAVDSKGDAISGSDDDNGEGEDGAGKDDEKSFLDVLWKIFNGIDNFLKTPLNVLEKLQYTISRVCDKIEMIKSTLENDIFKRAFALVKKKLIKILKMILPDKCDVDVMFGSGDPATTAEIFAFYSALYPVLFKKVKFTPDFERKVVFADAHIKGHITVFTIVYSAAVCYFNKDVKKTIKRFKKIMES